MKVGLACDLKESVAPIGGQPDDALEEYDSPETVVALSRVLESLGHEVITLGGGRDFLTNILRERVDFVFNIAEGRGTSRSRESQVPAVLEMLDIPYSGADPQCLAICLDKPLTKKLAKLAGILTPQWKTIAAPGELETANWDKFPFPAFVKPAYEGSSKGIRFGSNVENTGSLARVMTRLLNSYRQPVMVEEFISGDEVTVGMLGNSPPDVVGIMRVLPRQKGKNDFIYSLEVKRDWENLVEYECPARLPEKVLAKIRMLSLKAFKTLECRDFARLDYRVRDGVPYFLEINPLAGLNPRSSDLPIMMGQQGWSYERLITAIFNAALSRYR